MSAKNKQSNLIVDDVEELENDSVDDEAEEEVSSTRGITAPKGRATPGRRTQEVEEEKADSGIVSGITSPFRSMAEYWEGVRSEMQKVIWPTREETQRLATIVLVVTIIASLVLGLLSLDFYRHYRRWFELAAGGFWEHLRAGSGGIWLLLTKQQPGNQLVLRSGCVPSNV